MNINRKIEKLHDDAMWALDYAEIVSSRFQRDAYNLEKQAALLAKSNSVGEPTESVLLRSAATLAYRCGEMAEARELINMGLVSGTPPHEIAQELKELLELVNKRKSK